MHTAGGRRGQWARNRASKGQEQKCAATQLGAVRSIERHCRILFEQDSNRYKAYAKHSTADRNSMKAATKTPSGPAFSHAHAFTRRCCPSPPRCRSARAWCPTRRRLCARSRTACATSPAHRGRRRRACAGPRPARGRSCSCPKRARSRRGR
jgi:hypothetical protein